MLHLYIGNKNYSSWSMRAGVLVRQAGIPFKETLIEFDTFGDPESDFKKAVLKLNPAGRVPVLVDGDLVVWDSLAISEYLAEKFPEKQLWPQDAKKRARARSVCAEMHAGFSGLRTFCPMNIEASQHEAGAIVWRDKPQVRQEIQRIVQMWTELLEQNRGPMLFGEFTIADSFFAPVCMRIKNYGLPVPGHITDYVRRVVALPGVKSWIDEALLEKKFVAEDEPYRASR